MCLDFLKGTLLGDSLAYIDINISSMGPIFSGVDRTDHWSPEMDLPALVRSYLVVGSSAVVWLSWFSKRDSMGGISCMIFISIYHRWVRYFRVWIGPTIGVPKCTIRHWTVAIYIHGWYWYQFFIDGSNIWCVDRTDPWSSKMGHPPLIFLTGLCGRDFISDIDINPSWMGPIFRVWIGTNFGAPKWTTHHWAAAIW